MFWDAAGGRVIRNRLKHRKGAKTMNRKMLLPGMMGVTLIVLLLVGCGVPAATPTPVPTATSYPTYTPVSTATAYPTYTPVPTSTPMPTATPTLVPPTATPIIAVKGSLKPWGDTSPINDRRIVLCQIVGDERTLPADCVLMKSSATSDAQGGFQIHKVPPGAYFILYNSGLTDFEAGLERWGGKELKLGNVEWLVKDYIVGDLTKVELYLPDGAPLPTVFNIVRYVNLTLSLDDSPFIVSHDIEKTFSDKIVKPVIVEVREGQASQVTFPVVLYFPR